jgi:uncharacterized membrane protein
MKVNKIILVPLISATLEFVKQSTGYELPFGNNADTIADVVLWIIATAGVFIHPKREVLSDAEKRYLGA